MRDCERLTLHGRRPESQTLVLSVRTTGFTEAPESPAGEIPSGESSPTGMISRLFRSFMPSPRYVNGENSWEKCMNHLGSGEQADFFRLNIPIEIEVEPDDVDQLESLRLTGREYVNAQSVYAGVVEVPRPSVSYFGLDKIAEYRHGNCVCHGAILGRTDFAASDPNHDPEIESHEVHILLRYCVGRAFGRGLLPVLRILPLACGIRGGILI